MKNGIDHAQAAVTQRYARRLSEALRGGSESYPPAALTAALTRLAALHQAVCELDTESQIANQAAAKANAAVAALVDEICIDAEFASASAEAIAHFERGQLLFDRITGIARRDNARPGGPRLHEKQASFLKCIDRRQAAIAKDALNIEDHYYRQYRDSVAIAEERASEAYARRLADDASARFEESLQ